ncbi:hypothetical protein, partial [Trichothermofontia sp.]
VSLFATRTQPSLFARPLELRFASRNACMTLAPSSVKFYIWIQHFWFNAAEPERKLEEWIAGGSTINDW